MPLHLGKFGFQAVAGKDCLGILGQAGKDSVKASVLILPDVLLLRQHPAPVGPAQAGNNRKEGRLARAVVPQKGKGFPLLDRKAGPF